MSETRHVANVEAWTAICTAPDLCKVGNAIIAFDSFATLSNPQQTSPDVKARCTPVYRQGDLFKIIQADAGQHIVSGTSLGSGYVKILEGQTNVKVNNIPVARHDSKCLINCDASGNGGTMGKLVTEQKGASPTPPDPQAASGEKTSPLLEKLKAERAEIIARQLNLDALDEYINFEQTHQIMDGWIGEIQGESGTGWDYAAQATRGVLGFGKDIVLGIGELGYEGVKAVPKLNRRAYTADGQRMSQLDGAILAENIKLGNVSWSSTGQGLATIGKAVVKPVTDPWAKGQYVESMVRGAAEVASVALGVLKAGKLADASKAATATKAANTAKAAEVANLEKGGTVVGEGIHIKSPSADLAGGLESINNAGFGKDVKRYPYTPEGKVIPQSMPDSCVAAACKMKLSDIGIDVPEAYLRSDLGWVQGEGASFRNIPGALAIPENGGMVANFSRDSMRLRELANTIKTNGSAIANVNGHAVVVDNITNGIVNIRDPLHGAYGVSVRDFLSAWNNNNRVTITFTK